MVTYGIELKVIDRNRGFLQFGMWINGQFFEYPRVETTMGVYKNGWRLVQDLLNYGAKLAIDAEDYNNRVLEHLDVYILRPQLHYADAIKLYIHRESIKEQTKQLTQQEPEMQEIAMF